VIHTAGWPLANDTYGGSFLYHLENNQVAVGYVVGLAYKNPYLSPFEEFQRYKTHPAIREFLEGGKRLAYGARAIVAGGINALPELVFPGGALIGCDAGFLNASRIKGSHAAIKTGMLAAEAAFDAVGAGRSGDDARCLSGRLPQVVAARRTASRAQLQADDGQGPVDGHAAGRHRPGRVQRQVRPGRCTPPLRPRDAAPGQRAHADRVPQARRQAHLRPLSSVFISNTNHEENQPIHLTLKNASVPVDVNLAKYAGPESRYCPAGVYEFMKNDDGSDRLQINAQNCVHCKTCDIKDPTQNIVWVVPEGGGGPELPEHVMCARLGRADREAPQPANRRR
jgi:electron-transferring-flavoprotein dehydrogenase